MSNHVVADRVRDLYRSVLTAEPPGPGTDLIENGLIDSLGLVELIFALEQEFQLSISLDDLELDTFRSIENIADFVEAQASAAG